MKKYLFLACATVLAFFSSCSNDDILVEVNSSVTVTVDPSNLFSSYDFIDTKHNITQVGESFRTFYSESEKYIQVRTLFYNRDNETLVDSLVHYITSTNVITETINLPMGNYYAITTLVFADDDKSPWWVLEDKESLSTVKLYALNRFSMWSIMSQSAESFTLGNSPVTVQTTPKPVGSVIYQYFQNFQYVSEASYGTVGDNNIRRLAIYSQSRANSFNLDPNALNRFNYAEATGSGSWYYCDYHEPQHFDNSWTYFRSNLYGYCYVMEPSAKLCFGYMLKGESTFHAYGQATYNMEPGQTQLAYWDYFKLGNPYFGPADNNHWNSYSSSSGSTTYYQEPYTNWGASKSTVKSVMSSRGYTLYSEETNQLAYNGKYKEILSFYNFSNGSLWDVTIGFSASDASVSVLRSQVASQGYIYQSQTENDGVVFYYYSSGNTWAAIYASGSYTYVEYFDYNQASSSRRVQAQQQNTLGVMSMKAAEAFCK